MHVKKAFSPDLRVFVDLEGTLFRVFFDRSGLFCWEGSIQIKVKNCQLNYVFTKRARMLNPYPYKFKQKAL
jgi:hypothetical protein